MNVIHEEGDFEGIFSILVFCLVGLFVRKTRLGTGENSGE